MKIKTLDINGKEWFDKINGNSYHSVQVTINYGMKNAKTLYCPFTYGYDDFYKQTATERLIKDKYLKMERNNSLWRYAKENNIIVRASIQRDCKQKDVKTWGIE